MSFPVRFLPAAQAEFDQATDWYAARNAALARDFVARVDAVIERIAKTPKIHTVIYGDVRKSIVSRFPFIVLYREEAGELLIVSIFHTSRDPSEWQSRVD
jgi:plasmid stabilization system protein ParE